MSAQPHTPSVGTRWAELVVALLILVLAALVITDSLRVGIGWADDGPRSGYFPFRIGLGLALCSGYLVLRQLWRWRQTSAVFAQHSQLRDVAAVFVPTVAYVALIPWLGIYLPGAALVAWFMVRNGHYRWYTLVLTPLSVSVVLFLTFERWFMQPLPKGPLEHWLGF